MAGVGLDEYPYPFKGINVLHHKKPQSTCTCISEVANSSLRSNHAASTNTTLYILLSQAEMKGLF